MSGPEYLHVCSVFFCHEYHDFLICFDARTALSLFVRRILKKPIITRPSEMLT